MAADRNDPDFDGVLESFATHCWKKRIAENELRCWGTGAVINKDDTYYEYMVEVRLYGTDIEMPNPTVTKQEYFKHVLKGTEGFKYYDKNEK